MVVKKIDGFTIIEGEFIRNVSVRTGQVMFEDCSLPARIRNASEFCTRMVHAFLHSQGYRYGTLYVRIASFKGLDDFELSVLYRASHNESALCAGLLKTTPPGSGEVLHGTLGVTLYADKNPPHLRKDLGIQYKRWDCTVDIGALIG
jgi:hypothetical protein